MINVVFHPEKFRPFALQEEEPIYVKPRITGTGWEAATTGWGVWELYQDGVLRGYLQSGCPWIAIAKPTVADPGIDIGEYPTREAAADAIAVYVTARALLAA
ncbi:hypothetical protein [Planomonospora sp. ID82291]|uniref:hypothetical protein n=1 Tax=Planomonospora sp. ID82291 TaxID=2738136 RepID=UPI0018C36360|nr:hypothetical protein [Planomonospora sp. ID82291]MBG0819030.1 hypothetical protein [Planomonospora sp. ID82291]